MISAWQHGSYQFIQKLRYYQGQGLTWKAAYVILQQFDFFLTTLAAHYGLFEINPLMRDMLDMPVPLLMTKFVIPLFIAWIVPGRLLAPAIVLLGAVGIWNLKELLLFLP